MPSTVVHHYFAKDVYEKLNGHIQRELDLSFLNITTQGPDHFYFHQMYSLGFNQKYNKLASLMHHTNTGDYIINMAKYIKENHLVTNKSIMSYFYGTVMHMILDSTIHPYVFYKTGSFKQNIKSTYKYNGLHKDMETFLDCYFIYTREQVMPDKKKVYKILEYNFNEDEEFKLFLDTMIKNTYNLNDGYLNYIKSVKANHFNHKWIRHDRFHIKKILIKLIDLVLQNKWMKKEHFCYSNNFKRKYHYLNLEKNEWNNPTNQYEYSKASFIELYVTAKEKAIKLIHDIDIYFSDNKDLRYLKRKIPNIDYSSGKDLSEKAKMKYFEY